MPEDAGFGRKRQTMTRNRNRKQSIRARMAATGENYTRAARRPGAHPAGPVVLGAGPDGAPVTIDEANLRRHTLLFAGTGAGWTVAVQHVIAQLLGRGWDGTVLDQFDLTRDVCHEVAVAGGHEYRERRLRQPRNVRRTWPDPFAGLSPERIRDALKAVYPAWHHPLEVIASVATARLVADGSGTFQVHPSGSPDGAADLTGPGLTYVGLDEVVEPRLTQMLASAALHQMCAYAERESRREGRRARRFMVIPTASLLERDVLRELVVRARSGGIALILCDQSPAGWESRDPRGLAGIRMNTATTIVMRHLGREDAAAAARLVGLASSSDLPADQAATAVRDLPIGSGFMRSAGEPVRRFSLLRPGSQQGGGE